MKINVKVIKLKRSVLKSVYILGQAVGINRRFLSVLCYHSFSSSADKYSVSVSDFKEQVKKIGHYSNFIDNKELENNLKGQKTNVWGVSLTIDDGYQDVEKIVPIVKKLKIPVILFVLSDREKANRKELDNNHKLLSLQKIKKLHKLGWTIGCHSATHADFSKLNDKKLTYEIIDSKKDLEKKLGFKINYFAYPKGIVNKRILMFVKKAGYKMAFTTQAGTINSGTNPLLIPRTVIDKSKTLSDFPYFFSKTGLYLRSFIENTGIWKMISKFN